MGDIPQQVTVAPRRHRPTPSVAGAVALVIGVGGIMAGGVVTAASSPATTPPVVGEPTDPTGLGDDPANDALAQSCFDGDLESCDDLYWGTAVGSDYEAYGSTCGGRLADGVFGDCVETIGGIGTEVVQASTLPEPTLEPTGLGTDPSSTRWRPTATPAWCSPATSCSSSARRARPTTTTATPAPVARRPTPSRSVTSWWASRVRASTSRRCPVPDDDAVYALIATCAIGDMQTCDDLYRQSEPSTEFRTVGDTCAGRQPENTGELCVNAFPAWEQLSVVPDGTDNGSDHDGPRRLRRRADRPDGSR